MSSAQIADSWSGGESLKVTDRERSGKTRTEKKEKEASTHGSILAIKVVPKAQSIGCRRQAMIDQLYIIDILVIG